MLSGSFEDFQWSADIDDYELDYDEGFLVEVMTPTGGTISFEVYGPFESEDIIGEIIQEDVEDYVLAS